MLHRARRPTKPRTIFGREVHRKIPPKRRHCALTMEGYGVSKKDKPHYFDPQKWKQQKMEKSQLKKWKLLRKACMILFLWISKCLS